MPTFYLLRQPDTLESLAIDKLAVWIALQARKLISELRRLDAAGAQAALAPRVRRIRSCLESNMPRTSHDALLPKAMAELHALLADGDMHVLARMVETLFSEKLTSLSLDLEQFKMFREPLRCHSRLLTGLTRLDLNVERSNYALHYPGDIENDIIQMLQELHGLKYLVIENVCTDRVLRCAIENCTLIEELYIDSLHVSLDTMSMLIRLRNLRTIALRNPVQNRGIIRLLLTCENIENIYTYGNDDKIWSVLRQFANSQQNAGGAGKLFNLKSYRCTQNTLEELQTIFRMCPDIQNLTLHAYRVGQSNLMAMIGLRDLCELTLDGYDFYSGQVVEALQVIGMNLVQLHLMGVAELDLNAMMIMSQTCPNLETLSIDLCTFVDIAPSEKELDIPPFRSIKKLTLDITSSFFIQENPLDLTPRSSPELKLLHEPIFFLLSNCLNIETVEFTRTVMLTEDVMINILDKNPLSQLREFTIEQSESVPREMTSLTAPVLRRLARHCARRPRVAQVRPGARRARINETLPFSMLHFWY